MTINFDGTHGRFATDRFDFNSHVNGSSFNHVAGSINLNPTFSDGVTTYTTVQQVITNLNSIISKFQSFITVGSGYSVFDGTTYDTTKPSFSDYLNDIITNSLNPFNSRLSNGGVILIKEGTYKITGSVTVPPGVCIMGETGGVYLINQTSSAAPMFIISPDLIRIEDNSTIGGAPSDQLFMYTKEVKFYNLAIADNYLSPLFMADVTYQLPKNITADNNGTLILVKAGASFTCDNVKFLGKTKTVAGTLTPTAYAIKVDNSTPSTQGTNLQVVNCFMDGFGVPIYFDPAGFNVNYLTVLNNKIRAWGLSATPTNYTQNSFIVTTGCNMNISNNYFFGDTTTTTPRIGTGVFVSSFDTTYPYVNANGNAYSRVVISNNQGVVSKFTSGGGVYDARIFRITEVYTTGTSTINNLLCSIAGNTFGTNSAGSWSIVVAGFGSNHVGDFNGYGAIDLAVQYLGTNSKKYAHTLLVCDGDYVIRNASLINSGVKLLGIKSGSTNYPRVLINANIAGRTVYFSDTLKSIHFKYDDTNVTDGTILATMPTVTLDYGATGGILGGELLVEDCIFEDVILNTPDILDAGLGTGTIVKDTYFMQTGVKNRKASCNISLTETVKIENCQASVSGPLLVINSATTTTNVYSRSNIIVSDCSFNFYGALPGVTNASSQDAGFNNSMIFIGSNSTAVFRNNRISFRDTNQTVSNFSVTFAPGAVDNNYSTLGDNAWVGKEPSGIKIRTKSFLMEGCTINGIVAQDPTTSQYLSYLTMIAHTNTSGTITTKHAVPTMFLSVIKSIRINDCIFDYCQLPLQISGNSLTGNQVDNSTYFTKNYCSITNTEFKCSTPGTVAPIDETYTPTLLLFDIKNVNVTSGNASYGNNFNDISIDNCKFVNYAGGDIGRGSPDNTETSLALPALHYNNYDTIIPYQTPTGSIGGGVCAVISFIMKALGTSTSGDVDNVRISNCVLDLKFRRLLSDTFASVPLSYFYGISAMAVGLFNPTPGYYATTAFNFHNNKLNVISNIQLKGASSTYEKVIGMRLNAAVTHINHNSFTIYNDSATSLATGGTIGFMATNDIIPGSMVEVMGNTFDRNINNQLVGIGVNLGNTSKGIFSNNIFSSAYMNDSATVPTILSMLVPSVWAISNNVNVLITKKIAAEKFVPLTGNVGFDVNTRGRKILLNFAGAAAPLGTDSFWSNVDEYNESVFAFIASPYSVGANAVTVKTATTPIDSSAVVNFNWVVPVDLPQNAKITRIVVPYFAVSNTAISNFTFGGLLLLNGNVAAPQNSAPYQANWTKQVFSVASGGILNSNINASFSPPITNALAPNFLDLSGGLTESYWSLLLALNITGGGATVEFLIPFVDITYTL